MMATPWQMRASPMTRVRFRGQRVHVKRDDVFHLAGNKMRKLYWFLQQGGDFYNDAHLISFGGTQSNAMLAIAQLCHAKNVPFTYFSRQLDIKTSPLPQAPRSGLLASNNLAVAKALGMHHIELSVNDYHELADSKDLLAISRAHLGDISARKPVFIPQGAAFRNAEDGIRVLAEELNSYCAEPEEDPAATGRPPFSIIVPCGTGATAFYLAQYLHPSIRLLAVPCVGDSAYLVDQFHALAAQHPTRQAMKMPEILIPSQKARFGRLSWQLFDMFHELRDATAIEFDLLYAAFAWQTLFEPDNLARALESASGLGCRELLYIHTGGVSGNSSMLARYHGKRN